MIETISKLWWVFILRGLLAILFGVVAFAWPGLTLATMVIFFATYALIDGVFTLIKAFSNWRELDHRWLLLLEGTLGILIGLLTWHAPALTAIGLLVYIAMWSVVTGAFRIAMAFRLRKEIEGEWLLGLSGLLSILFGLMLVWDPGVGALAVLWLIGGYAIAFGVVMVMLGFRVRGATARIGRTVENLKARGAGA
jgi:uncharacterized membrane protein HdeD (DUF308 family)